MKSVTQRAMLHFKHETAFPRKPWSVLYYSYPFMDPAYLCGNKSFPRLVSLRACIFQKTKILYASLQHPTVSAQRIWPTPFRHIGTPSRKLARTQFQSSRYPESSSKSRFGIRIFENSVRRRSPDIRRRTARSANDRSPLYEGFSLCNSGNQLNRAMFYGPLILNIWKPPRLNTEDFCISRTIRAPLVHAV